VRRADYVPTRPAPAPAALKASSTPETPPRYLSESLEKLVVGANRDSVALEQYRRLAATLHEAQVGKGLKTVVVTSAVPKEGKTLTAANLALTLSESYGRRVLLVDADLRRPQVHQLLGIGHERGLAEVLRGDKFESSMVRVSPLLTVLPAGRPDPNPQAGLSSDRMRQFVDDCALRFDWVILDTPPLALQSDAQLLARLTQAVVFVIRAGSTPFEVVNRAVAELGRECIVGTVLNGVDEAALPERAYYGEYYQNREP
jgi:capsular exopolysaccharide synthesis family protein